MRKLESGELDAALLYWTFCARLEARGFRRLIGADGIAEAFGVTGPIALLGYVFDEGCCNVAPHDRGLRPRLGPGQAGAGGRRRGPGLPCAR